MEDAARGRGRSDGLVRCRRTDGLVAVQQLTRRNPLVLLDPFRLTDRCGGGPDTPETFRALAHAGTPVLLWYPLNDAGDRSMIAGELPPGSHHVEFWLNKPAAGLAGCGLAANGIPVADWRAAVALVNTLAGLWGAELARHG